jgi:hypothetical protein
MRSQPPIASENVRRPATLRVARVVVELDCSSWVPYPPKLRIGLLFSALTRCRMEKVAVSIPTTPIPLLQTLYHIKVSKQAAIAVHVGFGVRSEQDGPDEFHSGRVRGPQVLPQRALAGGQVDAVDSRGQL